MEYCCHVWTGAPSCYLELLDKLQKPICRTVGPSLATSLEPLAHRQNEASLNLFYMYFFGRCSSELAQLVPLNLIECMIFLSQSLDVARMVYSFCLYFSCNFMPFSGCSALHGVNPNSKKTKKTQPCIEWIPIQKKKKNEQYILLLNLHISFYKF